MILDYQKLCDSCRKKIDSKDQPSKFDYSSIFGKPFTRQQVICTNTHHQCQHYCKRSPSEADGQQSHDHFATRCQGENCSISFERKGEERNVRNSSDSVHLENYRCEVDPKLSDILNTKPSWPREWWFSQYLQPLMSAALILLLLALHQGEEPNRNQPQP